MQMPDAPVIMLTTWGTVNTAVTAMRLGAKDYLTKPWDNTRLLASVRTHLQLSRTGFAAPRCIHPTSSAVRPRSKGHWHSPLVWRRPMRPCCSKAPQARANRFWHAQFTRPVRAHAARLRIEVHVGALPDTLFERETLGHARGAFTDAKASVPGRVALAKGGTLFLDGMGTHLGPLQQVKLLRRLLQDSVYEPLGSPKSERADVHLNRCDERRLARRGRGQALQARLVLPPRRVPAAHADAQRARRRHCGSRGSLRNLREREVPPARHGAECGGVRHVERLQLAWQHPPSSSTPSHVRSFGGGTASSNLTTSLSTITPPASSKRSNAMPSPRHSLRAPATSRKLPQTLGLAAKRRCTRANVDNFGYLSL